ncbi:MAG: type II toxin-antitoxin system HicA family toxin [Candidatus Atribacteria bacterium]|nr:type II toxin-antitoxin system HicA family toxin [Candidatus Atribacteria bacterium]
MPKIPRDISGRELAKLLKKYGYEINRKTGSHIRLVSKFRDEEHKITVPDHHPIKIGTLNNILNDLVDHLKIDKKELINKLFKK